MALTKDVDLAEHLGVEVVEQNGSLVLRWRITEGLERAGKWESRPATASDVVLWDALRAMVMMRFAAENDEATARRLMDAARADLLAERNLPRLTPKGGDRNEFARQVRRLAKRAVTLRDDAADGGIDTPGYAREAGALDMANRVLVMLGEEPLLDGGRFPEVVERQELVDSLTRARVGIERWSLAGGSASWRKSLHDEALLIDRVLGLLAGDTYVDKNGHWQPVALVPGEGGTS